MKVYGLLGYVADRDRFSGRKARFEFSSLFRMLLHRCIGKFGCLVCWMSGRKGRNNNRVEWFPGEYVFSLAGSAGSSRRIVRLKVFGLSFP